MGVCGPSPSRESEMRNLKSAIRKLIWWVLAVWVAVALLQFNPLIGLGGALIGGILFGLTLFK